jgi:chaperonin GroEL
MRTILNNAGVSLDSIEGDLLSQEDNYGYDVKDYNIGDMFEKGIIDPSKVIRLALENAASVATTVLLTNTTITHKRSNEGSSK